MRADDGTFSAKTPSAVWFRIPCDSVVSNLCEVGGSCEHVDARGHNPAKYATGTANPTQTSPGLLKASANF